jgi:hypothetical protein
MGYNNTVQNRSNERITEFFLYSNSYSNDQQRNKCKTYVERVRTWSISKVMMLSLPLKENNYNSESPNLRQNVILWRDSNEVYLYKIQRIIFQNTLYFFMQRRSPSQKG